MTSTPQEAQLRSAFPVLTSALVVTRACLSSPDEAVKLRIARHLDEYLDTFSSRCKVRRACKKGLPRSALEYLAARDPDWGSGSRIAEYAAMKGFLHVIEWVGECYPERTVWNPRYDGSLMDTAAEFGHLSILQWLHASRSEGCTTDAMDRAAAVGHLEVVEWLHRYRGEGCTKKAMDDAAAHGHLAVVEWLHSKRGEGCSKAAIRSATANGHLAVVRFLLENRREVCTSDAMRYAAANGHLEIVQWLYVNRGDSNVGAALRYAAENGHTEVVEWLYWYVREQRRGDLCIRDAVQIALKAGQTKVAKLLDRKLKQEASRAKPQQRGKKRRRRQ
ncbi:hypothetical protein PF007_g4595 [Phytophthora fragariae]|uniref:Uncharacterized protein n=2 Tax=Phytophthora TaxID=4783 RepID=A0A6A3FIA5_9STRA|nr:hypothetical protein PF003_g14405 [Phytophthora fragariae]KAE9033753.1 hypothetical protein PR002_g8501 [Phytophthora rubi]KAE8945469.1 hypothetical protein PF009_g4876 [Phytophthora fragariae]KAE9036163.1 hypothetical protein PR001_g8962 [Phytophthora rubi]KAE9130190.1 hypothetical protein PF007_g4595 [Phytophthora fragariae]